MGKKISTFKGIKVGQKFKVISNISSHCYPLDTILTFKKPGAATMQAMSDIANEVFGNSIRPSEIELVEYTVAEMTKERNALVAQIEEIDFRIAFCIENDMKEYDENTFKVYKALKVINSLTTDMDKAKQIATLLN